MDEHEAQAIATRFLDRMRKLPYGELKRRIEESPLETAEESGPSGMRYFLEIETLWDGKPYGNIRVLVAIDDAGLRAFHPLLIDFIKAPDDSFVGE